MARHLIEHCFPNTAGLLKRASPAVFDYLLPQSCTPLALGGVAYATLLPFCVFGLVASLHGFLTIKHSIYRRSLLYYACMNVVAAMSHCQLYNILSLKATKDLWLAADVGFTGACALCLCLAAITRSQSSSKKQALQQLSGLVGPAALAVALLGNCVSSRTVPFLNELLYVLPTLLAAVLLFVKEVLQPGLPAAQRRTITAAACCFLVTPPLLLVNPLLCRYASSAGGCWCDATQLYFLGCNVAMMLIGRIYTFLSNQITSDSGVGTWRFPWQQHPSCWVRGAMYLKQLRSSNCALWQSKSQRCSFSVNGEPCSCHGSCFLFILMPEPHMITIHKLA
ncbi:hypothetical protein COO60DRAFT_1117900 [Scenedesmus sp. NREL 46B-D3]|nr:hypothetical protein COO60DRAFT_1117900 [Scenedesmus sp. NREL 46B-D3]